MDCDLFSKYTWKTVQTIQSGLAKQTTPVFKLKIINPSRPNPGQREKINLKAFIKP